MGRFFIKSAIVVLAALLSATGHAKSPSMPMIGTQAAAKPGMNLDGFLQSFSSKVEGGNSGGGGGNGFKVAHPSPDELRQLYSEKKVLLLQFLNRLQNALVARKGLAVAADSLAVKMFGDDLLSPAYQETMASAKIEFADREPCYNERGEPRLGSIFPHDKTKDICLSTFLISTVYNQVEAPAQLLGLALHEGFHLHLRKLGKQEVPSEEVEVQFINGQFIAGYESMNADLRHLQTTFAKRIRVWRFPLRAAIDKPISRAQAEQVCQTMEDLVQYIPTRNEQIPVADGVGNNYDALFSVLDELGLAPARTVQDARAKLKPLLKKLTRNSSFMDCADTANVISATAPEFERIRDALFLEIERLTGLR